MGGLFSTRRKNLPDIQINLESPQPGSPEEARICERFNTQVLSRSTDLLARFAAYKDAQGLVAAAITSPSEEARQAAWDCVVPKVQLQMELWQFTQILSAEFLKVIQMIIEKLGSGSGIDIFQTIPALTKAVADAFDLILTMDEIKLGIPKLINDLAYFRRSAPSYNEDGTFDAMVEKSNETTIFWASPTPVLSAVIQAINKQFPPTSPNFQQLLLFLGSVADVGASILLHHRSEHERPNQLCLRCIVGGTLMFDQICPAGAFARPPRFHVLNAMELLVSYEPRQTALINGIKFGSKHLREDSADPRIKALFR
jgi:hypothetical protein